MSEVPKDWRKMHDYSGNNSRQVCKKCGKVLKGKYAKFVDKEPVCPILETDNIKELIKRKFWFGFIDEAHFWVEYHPFHCKRVTLDELL